jgi:hypothetical protein
MDSQFYIRYEIWDTRTDKVFITDSRDEAIAYFEDGGVITEQHITVSRPVDDTSTYLEVSTAWTEKHSY